MTPATAGKIGVMMDANWSLVWVAVGALLLVPGCPSDDGGNASDTDGNSSSTSSGTATNGTMPTTASASMTAGSMSGSSGSMSGSSAVTTDGGTDTMLTGDTTATDTTDTESADGSSTTGVADACSELGMEACAADDSCEAIMCQEYIPDANGGGFCLDERSFIGCQMAGTACQEIITTTCNGDDAPVFQCPNACIPAGWMECAPPVIDPPGNCPPETADG